MVRGSPMRGLTRTQRLLSRTQLYSKRAQRRQATTPLLCNPAPPLPHQEAQTLGCPTHLWVTWTEGVFSNESAYDRFAGEESVAPSQSLLSQIKRINPNHQRVFLCPVNTLLCKSLSSSPCEHTAVLNGYSDHGNRFLFQPSPEDCWPDS